MTLNKLKFPEPYKHEHPPVCDANALFEEQLTFSQRAADWVADAVGSWKFIFLQTFIFGAWILINITGWFYHWGPLPLYFDEPGSIHADVLCCFYHLDQPEASRKT